MISIYSQKFRSAKKKIKNIGSFSDSNTMDHGQWPNPKWTIFGRSEWFMEFIWTVHNLWTIGLKVDVYLLNWKVPKIEGDLRGWCFKGRSTLTHSDYQFLRSLTQTGHWPRPSILLVISDHPLSPRTVYFDANDHQVWPKTDYCHIVGRFILCLSRRIILIPDFNTGSDFVNWDNYRNINLLY